MLTIKRLMTILLATLTLLGCSVSAERVEDHIGVITPEQLNERYAVFSANYQRFQLSEQQQRDLNALPEDLSIEVYFATWCHDSEREVPKLLKALQHKSYPISLVALDYQKQDPKGFAIKAGIQFTPTIIIKRNNKEIGRIVERPNVDLIADILAFTANIKKGV